MTKFTKSPRFKSSPRSKSSIRRHEIKPRIVTPLRHHTPFPKPLSLPGPSRIPINLAMQKLRGARRQSGPIVTSKQVPTTPKVLTNVSSGNTLSQDLEGKDSEMESPMTVAHLVDPRNHQEGNIGREAESKQEAEIKRKLRDSRVAEVLLLIEKSKTTLERVQEMIKVL
jgi:hypothetical protein